MSTQAALYDGIDLELSWSEAELPERERTKHVHRLHPYLGKFVPQLAEVFLRRYARPGQLVWDPFAGSGTTLVEANAFGARAAGCDVSAFNCLLTRVKTATYEPAELLADVVRLSEARDGRAETQAGPYLERWFAPRAVAELLAFREALAATVTGEYSIGQLTRLTVQGLGQAFSPEGIAQWLGAVDPDQERSAEGPMSTPRRTQSRCHWNRNCTRHNYNYCPRNS
jgi:hypothetical protein